MKIQFFENIRGLDNRAINGGIYLIELLQDNCEDSIRLYIGESGCMIERCSEHLYELFKDTSYFGLYPNDITRDDLTLRFSILERIEKKREGKRDLYYEGIEKKYISAMNPLTQKKDNDDMVDINEKIDKIQNEMKKLGFN
ncbi:MAG: hypothetical protein HDQ96_10125 [Lachnospiraceae bacterium]|nr:hypothetical protein [Lachnospiraceae bacterium]